MSEEAELRGWKAICAVVGRCERLCRRKAVRSFDPLPVWDDGDGSPVAFASALLEWKKRQRRPWSHKADSPQSDEVRQSPPGETDRGQ